MQMCVPALAPGLTIGAIHALFDVRSPAPPVAAPVGFPGIPVGGTPMGGTRSTLVAREGV